MMQRLSKFWHRISPLWRFIIYYMSAFFVIKFFLNVYLNTMDPELESSMQLKRVIGVFKYEYCMVLADIIIYTRVRDLFQRRPNDGLDMKQAASLRSYQRFSRLLALIVIFLSHCVFFVFWQANLWLSSFVWLSAMGHGLYLHLFAFFVASWIGHQLLLQIYGRIPKLRPLMGKLGWIFFDTKLQTWVAIALSVFLCFIQWVTVYDYRITNVDIGSPSPKSKPPIRMAILSDIHMGGVVNGERLEEIVRVTNLEKPDLIAIVGDLVDGSVDGIGDRLTALRQLHAKNGVYYVSGNHEFYYGSFDEWSQVVKKEYRIDVLNNEIRRPMPGLCLVGLDERVDEIPNRIESTIWQSASKCNTSDQMVVLAHNPRIANYISYKMQPAVREKVHLVVSGMYFEREIQTRIGHVHAGQFYLIAPVINALTPYFWGHYDMQGSTQRDYNTYRPHIYVSAGVHFWAVPMKMIGFAEITILNIY